jgi:hypothetical protein
MRAAVDISASARAAWWYALARIDVTVGRVVSKRSTIDGVIDANWPADLDGIGVSVSSALGLVSSRFSAGFGIFP